jgi:hypothetical protein
MEMALALLTPDPMMGFLVLTTGVDAGVAVDEGWFPKDDDPEGDAKEAKSFKE